MFKISNRYLIATCGVLLHLMLGSTYAWSVYRNPIMSETGWSQSSIAFAFSLAIFCLGMSAAFLGKVVESFGPRITGSISACFYALGNILTGVAVANHQLWLLYLGYGLIGGIGLGIGYITPVSTIIKWFPDKRGLATGLAIMGFGFASLLTSPVAQFLMTNVGLSKTFYYLGMFYFLVMLIVSQFIHKPSQADVAKLETKSSHSNQQLDMTSGLSAKEALKTKLFYLLWIAFFINISCGLGLISVVAPMAQQLAHMTVAQASFIVGLMGIFNGLGRLLWASLSDYIGRPLTFTLLFIVNIIMTLLLMVSSASIIFTIALSLIMTCYGAGFSLIPPYLSDLYGAKELAILHGYMLTAWGMAALFGPMLLSYLLELSHSYMVTLLSFGLLYILGLVIILVVRRQSKAFIFSKS
ncbi:hypothetical protein HMPREF9318_01477 [Streptococcus urinalis FB127-CNA-2]|uniref:Transporter, major facilitator family protein n=1 Tax=Streptococcus urinalis 2285-97 TaxID=764291 RepID=G5KDL3_9STRE|nr:OFA family MFS transporter [Streptococcus urinalis]EHJ55996.1 transporter, major facilitator family protein [Streptococcus urinalis 2285-97]EKS19401.1 hypothetical protein HMPREF9318_01477 [Streptococcus urinalis FB127-CNA-2]VEF31532.1 major facilitator superfamily protein [Streptococcus urinalis]